MLRFSHYLTYYNCITTANVKVTTATTTPIIEQQLNAASKPAQSFQIQTIPANVAITRQPAIKVITTNQQPAQTVLAVSIFFLFNMRARAHITHTY